MEDFVSCSLLLWLYAGARRPGKPPNRGAGRVGNKPPFQHIRAARRGSTRGMRPLMRQFNLLLASGVFGSIYFSLRRVGSKYQPGTVFRPRGVAEKAAVSASAGVWKPGCMFKNPHFSFRQTGRGRGAGSARREPGRSPAFATCERRPSALLVRPELKGGICAGADPHNPRAFRQLHSHEKVVFQDQRLVDSSHASSCDPSCVEPEV